MRDSLSGVLPMLVTPFATDGSIALNEFSAIAEAAMREGASGLSVNGLAGEAHALSVEERRHTARAALDVAAGLPVVVGASASETDDAVVLARDAVELGAHAVMVAPPPRSDVHREELFEHYSRVAREVAPTAVMVQDAPAFLGVALDADFILELRSQHANVRFAKPESTPAADAIAALRPDRKLGIFGGHGGLYLLDILHAGADGVIPGCEHVRGFVDVWNLWQETRAAEAERQFKRLLPLLVAQFQSLPIFIASVKTVLLARGLLTSAVLREDSTTLGLESQRLLLEHARRAGALTNTTAGARQ